MASGDNWPFYLGGWILGKPKKMTQWKKCQFGGVACAKGTVVTPAPKTPLGCPESGFSGPVGRPVMAQWVKVLVAAFDQPGSLGTSTQRVCGCQDRSPAGAGRPDPAGRRGRGGGGGPTDRLVRQRSPREQFFIFSRISNTTNPAGSVSLIDTTHPTCVSIKKLWNKEALNP